jgi:hypothetical protein
MSRLDYIGRPWVAFNPKLKEHRQWFAEFQKSGTWGRTPVRFIIPDEDGDLLTLCRRKLIDYYVGKEFGKTAR